MLTAITVCTNISLCVATPSTHLNPGDPTQFRGSCTDNTWSSPECPSFCRNGESLSFIRSFKRLYIDQLETGNLSDNVDNGVFNCGGGNWYCSLFNGDTSCCARGTDIFYLGAFENITTIGGAAWPGYLMTTASSSSTQSLSIATRSITKATSSTSVQSLNSTTGIMESTTSITPARPLSSATGIMFSTTSIASSTSPSLPLSGSTGSTVGTVAEVGIGFGAAVGAIVLVAFTYLIWWQRKLEIMLKEQAELLAARKYEEYRDPVAELSGFSRYRQPRYELGGTERYGGVVG